MDIKEFSEIIDRNTEDFLEYIKKIMRSSKKYKFSSTFFFPILEDEKNYLYECKHYDRFLEMTIRECLVTNVLIDLIKALDDRHVSVERVPCEDLDSEYNYGRQINKYNIEFFLCVDGIRLGVCYNDLLFDETIRGSIAFLKYAKKNNLKSVLVIEWDDIKNNKASSKHVRKWKDGFGRRITMRRMFAILFPHDFVREAYYLYYDKITRAITEANKEIGLKAIPLMSNRYLSEFKEERLKHLAEFDYVALRYQVIKYDKRWIVDRASKVLDDDEYRKINSYFLSNQLYKALVGTENFAKCFLTSEYMYEIFKAGGAFEYTSIVSGYLKSVEQLLHVLVFNTGYSENLWMTLRPLKSDIRNSIPEDDIKKESKFEKIKYKEEYKSYFKKDMGSYRSFIHDNHTNWNIGSKGIDIICGYVSNFGDEDRNEHFHRDNIIDFSEVEIIRNNTILCSYCRIL